MSGQCIHLEFKVIIGLNVNCPNSENEIEKKGVDSRWITRGNTNVGELSLLILSRYHVFFEPVCEGLELICDGLHHSSTRF